MLDPAGKLEFYEQCLAGIERSAFLAGPCREDQRLDIDPVFASSWPDAFQDVLADLDLTTASPDEMSQWVCDCVHEHQLELMEDAGGLLICEAIGRDEYSHGVVALDPAAAGAEQIIGSYVGCKLAVLEKWRGQGVAAHLVKQRFLVDGSLPTWELDAPAYSPGGVAAHSAGFRLLQEEMSRLKDLSDDFDPGP